MTLLPFVFTALSSALALPMPPPSQLDNTMENCEAVMARNGINMTTFRTGAVHGIHSLYLEEIRHFFEPLAPANNGIPVVNADLTSEEMILLDSPLAGYDNDFNTMALKVMAFFMLNDVSNFYMQGTNVLEKISHQYHMHEIYAAAVPIYRSLKDNPPSDPLLCSCSNDISSNGIFDELVGAAHNLRNFAAKPSEQEYDYIWQDPNDIDSQNRLETEQSTTESDPKLFAYSYKDEQEPDHIDSQNRLKTKQNPTDPKLFVYHYKFEQEQNHIDAQNRLKTEQSTTESDPKLFVYNYKDEQEPDQIDSQNRLKTKKSPTDPKLFVYHYKFEQEANDIDAQNRLKTEQNPTDPKLFYYHYKFEQEPKNIDSQNRFPSKANKERIVKSEQVEEYKMEYLRQSNKETANKVLQVDPWQPNTLFGPAEWISYEAMLTSSMLGEEEIKDFATFIYCKLNSH